MPFWYITHTPNLFTPSDKSTLAQLITSIYTSAGLPAFLVNVHFLPLPATDFFIGGRPRPHSTTISIHHLARDFRTDNVDDAAKRDRFMGRVDGLLGEWFDERATALGVGTEEVHWEYFVREERRDLWRVDGQVVPLEGTAGWETWKREGRVVRTG